MNKKTHSLISSFIALFSAMIIFFSCASPTSGTGADGGNGEKPPVTPTLPEGQQIDLSDSSITAAIIVNSMKFGWNLGNTLDANEDGSNWSTNKGSNESDWGLKDTASDALFQKLYDSGIRTVRIPISWHNHVNESLTIDSGWMNHVKEVVNMAYSKGLYVIINIHHDNYNGSGNLGTKAGFTLYDDDKAQSLKYVETIWTQIANTFKDYDGHLVFETLNEPRIVGGNHEWGCTANTWTCTDCRSYFAIINDLNQKAVDTIRATGGNNAKRVIMFPAYVAAPYAAINAKNAGIFKVPTDSATKRLALSVHMYTPYDFAMNSPGDSTFETKHKTDLTSHFTALNSTFISKGIPVVIGEMGATNKGNFEARKEWFTYYLGLCKDYNVAAVLWDNGKETNSDPKEAFGFMNRKASGGPAWFTDSKAAELIAAAVEARGASAPPPAEGSWTSIWSGSQDLKHWDGDNAKIEIPANKFNSATSSSKIRFTISIGADCTATDCTNNYSTIQPITAWTDGNINFPEANSDKQLSVSPSATASTETISPDSTSWSTIKSKGLIIYGHKVVITKIELM